MRFTYEDLANRYSEMTASVICHCEAVTPLVGGITASDAGVKSFVVHHLKITDPVEQERAIERIKKEELGERPVPSETGELQEQLTYGINVIRRTAIGPYLANHMIHANIKTAASRLGMFVDVRGSKGNMAEGGIVYPYGMSRKDNRPDCVYLVDANGDPAETHFEEFKGRVQSPRGSTSVMHHSECVPSGTLFSYEFRFLQGRFTANDVRDFLAMSMIVGIGSVKSLGHGKFRILTAEIVEPTKPRKKVDEKKKEAKEEPVLA